MVSIIVPVYNIVSFLPDCVNSLTGQSCRDVEIVLVDDGSTDGSGALCDRFAAEDDRIRVIHKQNGGLSSARNAGIDAASGKYLLFVDGDDYLAAEAVQRLTAIAETTGADFVQFLYHETPDSAWVPDAAQQADVRICTDLRQMFSYLYERGGVAASGCTKLFRRTLFQNLRFQDGIRHEDEELMTRLLPRCRKVAYTELVLYGYRMRGGSIVHTRFSPGHMDIFPIMEQRIRTLQQYGYADLVRETRTRLFCTAAWQYCQARAAGYAPEAAVLKQHITTQSKQESLTLSGQYGLLYRLTRHCAFAPEIYYFIRKICGKNRPFTAGTGS